MFKDSKSKQEKLLKNWTIFPTSASNPYTRVKILGHSQVQLSQTQLDPAFTDNKVFVEAHPEYMVIKY